MAGCGCCGCPESKTVTFIGIAFDCPCAQTFQGGTLTSGTLVIGRSYKILNYVSGDDFTNVGGTNVTGSLFTATGTTPHIWTHGSTLRRVITFGYSDITLNGSHTFLKSDACLPDTSICVLFGSATVHAHSWNTLDCTGSPNEFDGDQTIDLGLFGYGGSWYLMAVTSFFTGSVIFFYDAVLSLGDGFTNSVTCDWPTGATYFDPLCPPGSNNVYFGFAEVGTAIVV